MWRAFDHRDYSEAHRLATKCIRNNYTVALHQESFLETHRGSYGIKDTWAASDVSECYFIDAKTYEMEGRIDQAIKSYQFIIKQFPVALVEEPGGWVWSPAEDSERELLKWR